MNSDFRIFLADMNIVLREVFRDTAYTVSEVAKETGKKLEPSKEEHEAVSKPGADDGPAPSKDELTNQATEVTQVVGEGAAEVLKDAQHNLAEKFSGEEKDTLLNRVKQAVLRLRKRPDYNDSVSTLSLLLRRYAKVYTNAAEQAVKTVEDDVNSNHELDEVLKNVWELITSFADRAEWQELERRFKQILQSRKKDPDVEKVIDQTGDSIQKLLTEPDFLNHADEKFEELKNKAQEAGTESDLRKDLNSLISQAQRVLQSVIHDKDVEKLLQTTSKEVALLSPANDYINKDLLRDSINVFVPQLIRTIQYIPIPRVEVSTPEIDLLLENIILEPGETVNHSSFLPYRLHVNTDNNFEIRKGRVRTAASADTTITIDISGLSVRAQDIGYVMHLHPNSFINFTDIGLASFRMDKRGLDLSITFEIRRNEPDTILRLRDVRTTIHTLDYKLRRSKFSLAAWLFAPLLRPIIRKSLEHAVSSAVADALRTANREVVFARERLRATRVADPDDLLTFIRAVAARWTPEPDPDLDIRVGVDSVGDVFSDGRGRASTRVGGAGTSTSQIGWDGKAKGVGVFRGVYAPGSVVKVWHEEADRAGEIVEDGEVRPHGWRNEIFDVATTGDGIAGMGMGMGTMG